MSNQKEFVFYDDDSEEEIDESTLVEKDYRDIQKGGMDAYLASLGSGVGSATAAGADAARSAADIAAGGAAAVDSSAGAGAAAAGSPAAGDSKKIIYLPPIIIENTEELTNGITLIYKKTENVCYQLKKDTEIPNEYEQLTITLEKKEATKPNEGNIDGNSSKGNELYNIDKIIINKPSNTNYPFEIKSKYGNTYYFENREIAKFIYLRNIIYDDKYVLAIRNDKDKQIQILEAPQEIKNHIDGNYQNFKDFKTKSSSVPAKVPTNRYGDLTLETIRNHTLVYSISKGTFYGLYNSINNSYKYPSDQNVIDNLLFDKGLVYNTLAEPIYEDD